MLSDHDHNWHSHAENVGHSHERGQAVHSHTGRRTDNGIQWTTRWADGSELVESLPRPQRGGLGRDA